MVKKAASVSIAPSKPRNPIVRALIGGLIVKSAGWHKRAHLKRMQAQDRKDLDQLVRESGEW